MRVQPSRRSVARKSHASYFCRNYQIYASFTRLITAVLIGTTRKGCDEESEAYPSGCFVGSGIFRWLPAVVRRVRNRLHVLHWFSDGEWRTLQQHGNISSA